ncbi:helix-turn-helix domain-containing protein [Flavobacterium sp. N1994]|uniref:helix-turn-helix domain-containing protein n=1 Tax=Flavobacterium sp. N1994 TaxID=2986827 RepID=UPI002221AA83|nr:AraC family transcriptional regulator [Flavobacterium sp. N1994]
MIDGIAEMYNIADLKKFSITSNSYTVLFIPCFYLYFKYLINNHKHFIFKDLLHIVVLFLAIIEREFLLLDSLFDCKLNYYLSQFVAVYVLVYLVVIFLLLKKNVWHKKATLSFVKTQNNLITKWTILFFIAINAFVLRFFLLYYKEYLFYEPLIIEPTKYLWVTALVWIVLFLIILSNPQLLYGYSYLQVETTKTNSDLKSNNYWNIQSKIKINNNQDQLLKEKISTKIEPYVFELNALLFNNSYFRNPDFSIKDLAQVLNIPNSHLKYIFKYHSKLSFSDYKKISRIQNSLELINNNYLTTNTLESLSKEVGFSSYNPFFTCFKDVVGKSPHQYISSINSD